MKLKDLVFKMYKSDNIWRARVNFINGYGASIVYGPTCYGDGVKTYELAVLHNNKICYDTHFTDNVLMYLSEDQVNIYLDLIGKLLPDVSLIEDRR